MSHLENLIAEYYDWKGYLVKRNIKVGKLGHGGWEMELDVIAFDPHSGHLIHIEPSIDAHSWARVKKGSQKNLERPENTFLPKYLHGLIRGNYSPPSL